MGSFLLLVSVLNSSKTTDKESDENIAWKKINDNDRKGGPWPGSVKIPLRNGQETS